MMSKKLVLPREHNARSLSELMTTPVASAYCQHQQLLRRREVRRKVEDLLEQAQQVRELW